MSENSTKYEIQDIASLDAKLKATVSEKRYIHSKGVASTISMLIDHYNLKGFPKCWNGFDAASFCGLAHDIAREMSDDEILLYCRENSIVLSSEEISAPVLAHGKVSAHKVMLLCGPYPEQYKRAIDVHTSGADSMDSIALALFIADYIEPGRTFLTDEKRAFYLGHKNIEGCAYAILCDMIEHWRKKGFHDASQASIDMKRDLEKRLEIE